MNRVRRTMLVTVLLVAVLAAGAARAQTPAVAAGAVRQQIQTPEEICAQATQNIQEPETREFKEAEQVLKEGVDYWAVLCTAQGPIYIDLLEKESPLTVNNFVFLAQQGFYNNTTFHRVLPSFMAQGGDPTGSGAGGPGYEFADETTDGLVFDQPGLLAMANAGENTNGSQFFITYAPTTWLNGKHTIFGRVYQGLDVAELLTPRDPDQSPDFNGDTLQTVVIIEDPATVSATPDGPPTLEHIQKLLINNIASQINTQFTTVEDYSHTYDLEAEATSWQEDGGDALVSFLRDYLAAHGFQGTAALLMTAAECPAKPEDLPIWALGFQVSDYGTDGAAEAVIKDNERADQFVSSGAFDQYTDPADMPGRIFSKATPEGEWCGPSGEYYRFETPVGRYIATVDLVVDSTIINDQSETPPDQYLGYIMQNLMLNAMSGTLDRGTAAAAQ